MFNRRKTLKFTPNDKIMDIYQTVYPPGSAVDAMELEHFANYIQKQYGLDLYKVWHKDLTLGDVFQMVRGK